jgi:polyhydroxyalkanoate synthesis regulator phasin
MTTPSTAQPLTDHESPDLVSTWKSPVRKLLRFFHNSREGWKQKHHDVKAQNKLLNNQVRAVEKSREKWKHKAKQAQHEVRELQQRIQQLTRQVEKLKNTVSA